MKKVQAFKVSGYVLGPCVKCGKEGRALVMFDDLKLGVECLACGEVEHDIEVEWAKGEDPSGVPQDL